MKRTILKISTILAIVIGSACAYAGETATLVKTRSKASAAVTLGKWHAGYAKAKAYAEKMGVPFVAVWSNGDACGHCITFESACNTSYFQKWQASSGMVFFFGYSGDSAYKQGSDVFHEIRGDNTSYPFIRLYWKKNGKVLKDVRTIGDTMDGGVKSTTGAKNVVAYIKKVFSAYKYNPVTITYFGGNFTNSDYATDAYEVEAGYAGDVGVRFVRTNATVIATAATNYLEVEYDGGPVCTNRLDWAAGQSLLTNDVAILPGYEAGKELTLRLLDQKYNAIEARSIYIVEEQENSPKNPLWLTERTVDTLGWGEWTMDIDAATNKVSAAVAGGDDKAVTMLLIGGPLWCPDCVNLEERLICTDAFRAWATNKHHVACVAIDEARFARGGNVPTLLSRESYVKQNSSTKAITAVLSGLGYMTRKCISDEDGAAVYARNLDYVNKRVGEGGFLQADTTMVLGGWQTGIPCILFLRPDGSVASRLFQFSNSTDGLREEDVEKVLKRLDEMIAMVDDPAEENNDGSGSTTETIGQRQTIGDKTLSFADPVDYYRLDPSTKGMKLSLRLDGTVATPFVVSVVKVAGESFSTVASAEADLSGGVVIPSCDVDTTNCYVKVSYPVDGSAYPVSETFALTNAASTLVSYSLSTDFIVTPTDVRSLVPVADGNPVQVNVTSGLVYRIAGITGITPAEALESRGEGLYAATATTTVSVGIDSGKLLDIQLWRPGKVGFASAGASVHENSGTYNLKFSRIGGVSSNASVTVTLDAERSSKLSEVIDWNHDGEVLTWNEGEDDVKSLPVTIVDNEFADGDQSFVFKVEVGGEAVPGTTNFVLTVRENDRPVVGKLGITGATPTFAKTMTVFAREGEEVTVNLGRYGGADGSVGCNLSASAGTLDKTAFSWAGRNVDTQFAKLTVPALAATKKLTVTIGAADSSTKIDVNAKKLTVVVLDENAPVFDGTSKSFDFPLYVPLEENTFKVPLVAGTYPRLKFAAYSGSIAPGLKMVPDYVNQCLVFSGKPTKAGDYTAVYRASNGSVAGGTVSVSFHIVDPSAEGKYENVAYTANAAAAKSRTVSDIIVTAKSPYDSSRRRMTGLLTVTVPKNGKVSAKYRSVDGTVNLAAKSWESWNPATGDLEATASGTKSSTSGYGLSVTANGDGTMDLVFTDPDHEDVELFMPNKSAAYADIADWKGYYTVSMPCTTNFLATSQKACGDGYMTLKMNTDDALKRGVFTYAGLLPNGKAVTGTSRLTEEWNESLSQWDYAHVPMLYVSGTDAFSGAMRLRPGASYSNATNSVIEQKCGGRCYYQQVRRSVSDGASIPLLWVHEGREDGDENATEFSAWGGLYVSTENFVSCCSSALGSSTLKFFPVAASEYLADTSYGVAQDWVYNSYTPVVTVKYAKLTTKAKTKTNQIVVTLKKNGTSYYNPYSYSMSFSLANGIVSGSYYLVFKDELGATEKVKQTFRGVVLPGWGYASCADCGYKTGGSESAERPFVSGTGWFKDGKTVRSAPISIGTEEGQ